MSADMNFIAVEAFRPGEFLRDELEERGWTQVDLAEILGKSVPLVNEVILGKREITPATAYALAEALGTSAQYWLNLETAYRLYLEAQKRTSDGAVRRRAKVYSKAPVKEMIRRGWLAGSTNIEVLERNVCNFLEIATIDDEPELEHAARKSASYGSATPALKAWICRARQIARISPVAQPYKRDSVPTAMEELQRLLPSAPEVRQVTRILANHGIRLVIVETINKAKVDGVTFWLDATSPVIVLSLRYDRLDWFWFTLIHELVHVKRGDGKNANAIIVDDLDHRELPHDEQLVNAEVQTWLLPAGELDDFAARTAPLYSRVKIENFARRLKVHPAIVVGHLHHRKEIDYSHFRALLVKVRDIVTANTLTDGWGFAPLAT